MQRFILSLFLLAIALPLVTTPAAAAPLASDPLCLPTPYSSNPSDCEPYGSFAYLNRMAEIGLQFPPQPLPASAPDPALSYLPYYYGRVSSEGAPVFATIEAAMAGKPASRYIERGFDYVSYIDVQEIDGKKFYMITPGEWMRGGDLSSGVAVNPFQGLVFSATPARKFGWILQPNTAQSTPGIQGAFTDREFTRWDIIQVYETREVDGLTWYLVGPDLWIEKKNASLVYPVTTPPANVENGRWIEVNLFEQTLAVYENNQMVFATLLSSGVPGFWTRPGLFQITEKLETTPMTGAFEADRSDYYYLEDVPWTMYFDEARALHGAYWHTKFGYEQSHGCVNLSSGDSRWLYDWASVGDWVYVWDASGVTPTDPSLYGDGGA
jgi:hypothetical protein